MVKEVLAETKRRMQKSIEDLTHQLATIRTGRASVHILDNVSIEYYGASMPLSQVATLHAPEPNLITIQPWDVSQLGAIEKAIKSSDLGLNPNSDGKILRVPIPTLTEERRRSLAKQVGKIAEEHRTAVRQVRRDANERFKKLLKDKNVSEDDERRGMEEVQKATDEFIGQVDRLAKAKEDEILNG